MCNPTITAIENEKDKISSEQFAILLKNLERLPEYCVQLKMHLKEKGILDLKDINTNMYKGILKRCDEELKKTG